MMYSAVEILGLLYRQLNSTGWASAFEFYLRVVELRSGSCASHGRKADLQVGGIWHFFTRRSFLGFFAEEKMHESFLEMTIFSSSTEMWDVRRTFELL